MQNNQNYNVKYTFNNQANLVMIDQQQSNPHFPTHWFTSWMMQIQIIPACDGSLFITWEFLFDKREHSKVYLAVGDDYLSLQAVHDNNAGPLRVHL